MKIRAFFVREEKEKKLFSISPISKDFAESPNVVTATIVENTKSSHSTAVTALILLLVLFFLCFFSVYARSLFAGLHRSSRSRRRAAANHRTPRRRIFSQNRGLDQSVVSALPVLYYVGCGEGEESCVICLAEFERKEPVKVIPVCGHLFHCECIDEWLLSHGSCPVCRRTDVLGDKCSSSSEHRIDVRLGLSSAGEVQNGEDERKKSSSLEKSSSCNWSVGEEVKGMVFLRRSCSL